MRRLLYTMLFLLAACIKTQAGEDSLQVIHFTAENGLPSDYVYQVLQDDDGYIWFATDKGVVKYDGYTFKIFNTYNGLPDNDVWGLYKDMNGRIFLNTSTSQIGYIKNDAYHALKLPTCDKLFNSFKQSESGNLYCGAIYHNDWLVIDIKANDEVLSFRDPGFRFHNLFFSDSMVWYFHGVDTIDAIYINKPWEKYGSYKLSGLYYEFLSLNFRRYEKNNQLYLGGFNHEGAYQINPMKHSKRFYDFAHFFQPGEYLYSNFIVQDSIMLFTNKGVYSLSDDMQHAFKDNFTALLNTTSQITYRLIDNNHNRWYCTLNGGAWCVTNKLKCFRPSGIPSVATEARFVGYSPGGTLFFWERSNDKLYTVNSDQSVATREIPGRGQLRCVREQNDSITIMGFQTGLFCYNRYTHKSFNLLDGVHHFHFIDSFLNDSKHHVEQILNDSSKYTMFPQGISKFGIWSPRELYVEYSIGLAKYLISGDTIAFSKIGNDCRCTGLVLDSVNNAVWAYGTDFVMLYRRSEGKLITFGKDILTQLGVRNIAGICNDGYGNMYIQSDDRITIINLAHWRMQHITDNVNLMNAHSCVWKDYFVTLGTFGLIARKIEGPGELGRSFATVNVRQQYFKTARNIAISTDGTISCITDKDLYRVSLDTLLAGNAAVLSPKRQKQLFTINASDKTVYHINNGDTLSLPQSVTHLAIDAINYLGCGHSHCSFVIADKDTAWSEINVNDIYFPELKADKFYHVTVKVIDDAWQSPPITFYIYHPPYWYQTTTWKIIFWILGFIALGLVVLVSVLITRHYVARANERKRVLTELELRAVYSQINPHFIFNTLSSVQYFINKKNFDDAYLHVNKFSRLLRAYLKSSQDRYITLAEEVRMLANYIELQKTRFETKFDYEIVVDNKLPADSIMIPSLLLQPLVENAINHGLFHKQGHGWLSVRFAQGADSSEVICTIEDNGVGRLKAKQINDANTTKRESYGTRLTQQLINIFNEFEHMDIHLDYTDKQAPDTGTIVTLTIRNVKYVA